VDTSQPAPPRSLADFNSMRQMKLESFAQAARLIAGAKVKRG
jgi:hypothetical protein